ncbi:hypothetical protein [Streptomyces chryseus]
MSEQGRTEQGQYGYGWCGRFGRYGWDERDGKKRAAGRTELGAAEPAL